MVTNYRPISSISNISKIFETTLKNRIIDFIKKEKILNKNQYGFREGKSTKDALAALTHSIYSSLDKGVPCLSVFIDLAKAFDTRSRNLAL